MRPQEDRVTLSANGKRVPVRAGRKFPADDPNSDVLYVVLERAFGTSIHGWPRPDDAAATEARINRVLWSAWMPPVDDDFRRRFREELGFGQLD